MRTIVELPAEQLEALAEISSQENASRAEIIRRAVGNYIQEKQSGKGKSAFGLWKKRKIDALKYQDRLGAEWEKKMKAVFDTNILVDYLNGVSAANRELDRYEEIAISIVTWIELAKPM